MERAICLRYGSSCEDGFWLIAKPFLKKSGTLNKNNHCQAELSVSKLYAVADISPAKIKNQWYLTAFSRPMRTGMENFPAFSSDSMSRILLTFKTPIEKNPQLIID